MTTEHDLAQAHADRVADIQALAGMSEAELRYLADAATLPDDITDELECDSESRADRPYEPYGTSGSDAGR